MNKTAELEQKVTEQGIRVKALRAALEETPWWRFFRRDELQRSLATAEPELEHAQKDLETYLADKEAARQAVIKPLRDQLNSEKARKTPWYRDRVKEQLKRAEAE